MTPEITPINEQDTATIIDACNVDSSFDNAGYIYRDNRCEPMEDEEVDNDNNYNSEYLDEYGTYENFLAGVQFKYEDFESDFTPLNKMNNGK